MEPEQAVIMLKPSASSTSKVGLKPCSMTGKVRGPIIPHFQTGIIFFPLLFVIVLFSAPPVLAQDRSIGKVITIDSGSGPQILNILRLGKTGFVKVMPGDVIFEGDTVKTGAGVKAQIQLSDQSIVNIGPNSALNMKAFVLVPAASKRNYVLKALKGTIRFMISKTFRVLATGAQSAWTDSNLTVESPTAIAGVKGTDFIIAVDTSKPVPVVDIAVIEGSVTVRNISLSIREAVTLLANQMTTVQRGIKPGEPAVLPVERSNYLIQITTPSVTVRPLTVAPAPAVESKEEEKYNETEMAKDLAAGVPLAEVLETGSEAGMTVDTMFNAAIEAGIEPSVLVYTAITDGYPAETVVAAAINQGISLDTVVSAAVVGGAESTSILSGATTAGAPAGEVATAFVAATAIDSAVYGYEVPESAPPISAILPPEVVVIGGNPGETASTQPAPASASKPRY